MVPGTLLGGRRVDLGTLRLGLVDSAGVAWRIGADGLQGWDSAEVRTQISQREADHGAWMGPTYLGERVITLGGTITAPTAALADAAVEQLLAAVPLDGYTTLAVFETAPKQAAVRRSGKPIIKWETDTVVTWSLLVTAPDPRRYGTTEHTLSTGLPSITGGLAFPLAFPLAFNAVVNGGTLVCRNLGTIAGRPVLTIAGPVSQPQVAATYPDGTASVLAYTADLAAGEVLALDTDARTAYLAGGVSRRRFVSGTWPELPPGDTVLAFRSPSYSSTASLTAAWRPAWI